MKKIDFFYYYEFYSSSLIRIIRFLILFGVALLLIFLKDQVVVFRVLLFIYTWFLVNEIFIYFKINSSKPAETVDQVSGHPEKAILFSARKIISNKDSNEILRKLVQEKEVEFLIDKLGGYKLEIVNFDKQQLLVRALELAKIVQGTYISSADIFAAFLLISEKETKTLLDKELTENDLYEILMWTRQKFQPDKKEEHHLHFTGYGVFDFFIYGWNTMLKEYSIDLTYSAVSENETMIVGREKEFGELVGILCKNSVNNVLIVGEPGVGKSSLVKRLANEAYKNTKFVLHNVTVYEILVDRLLSGLQSAGDLEERLGFLFAEASHTGNAILFIQNIENIFGGGGFGFDLSGTLFDYLKNKNIQIIGTTTPFSYKQVIEKKQSILSLFESIRMDEPDRKELLEILISHVDQLEKEYGVTVSYKAIHEVIELSTNYLPDAFLPGKAINLLQDAASAVRLSGKNIIERDDVIKIVEGQTNIVLERPDTDEKKVLLSLEDELHKRVIGQDEAITAVAKSIRRLRSGFSNNKRPISVFLFLGPTGVGKTETAKALAREYFGDENAMIRLDMSEFQSAIEAERLLGGEVGADISKNSLTEEVRLHPFSLILLDEFEKAYPSILDVFLQVFEDGRLTDNSGKTASFKNTIIIATSNAGSEAIREMMHAGKQPDEFKDVIIEGILRSGMFKPELLNRFDDVIIFKPLTVIEAKKVAALILAEALKSLEDDQIYIFSDDSVLTKIVNESYDEEAGARNMRRYIGGTVEDFISKLILEDKITKGAHMMLSVGGDNQFLLK